MQQLLPVLGETLLSVFIIFRPNARPPAPSPKPPCLLSAPFCLTQDSSWLAHPSVIPQASARASLQDTDVNPTAIW